MCLTSHCIKGVDTTSHRCSALNRTPYKYQYGDKLKLIGDTWLEPATRGSFLSVSFGRLAAHAEVRTPRNLRQDVTRSWLGDHSLPKTSSYCGL